IFVGHADQSAGQLAFEVGLHSHEPGVGAAEEQGDAEALGRADGDVRALGGAVLEQGQCQQVGVEGHQCPAVVGPGDGFGEVADGASGAGWAQTMPKMSSPTRPSARSATVTRKSMARARARTTEMVCGWSSESRTTVVPFFTARRMSRTASATAVASSRREALAMSRPVRSWTTCWKFSNARSEER